MSGEGVLGRWAAVAAARPAATAFASAGQTVTVRQADERSAAVAAALRAGPGPGPGDGEPLGLLVGHTASGMTALLGALRTGRPVVPLDPHRPLPWLREVVERTGVRVCLTDADRRRAAEALGVAAVPVEALLARGRAGGPPAGVPARSGDDALCVVATSGSTGRPKGVVYTHAMALADADAARDRLGVGPDDRVGLVLPLAYTAGLTVLLFGLLNGAGVHAADPREHGLRALPRWVTDEGLTTLHLTPHLLRSLQAVLRPGERLPSLRQVTSCGEAVLGRDVALLREHLSPRAVVTSWSGASEVGALTFRSVAATDPLPDGPLPVGRPLPGKQVRVTGADGEDLGPGEPGEVVVTSAALSPGYWRDPDATARRFSRGPDGRRVYRTGDLGRLDGDGCLHLLGRLDDAVKVRGQLVEPAEVEVALREGDGITEAAVVAVRDGVAAARLVAYVVTAAGVPPASPAAVRRRLHGRLPEHMVPATVVQLPALPRAAGGKLDRRALPPLPRAVPGRPPGTQWEVAVARLWAEVLAVETVDATGDFFELGGDSLAVVELLERVREELGADLTTPDLADAPTVAAFAARVAGAPRRPAVPAGRAAGTRAAGTRVAGVLRRLHPRRVAAPASAGSPGPHRPDATRTSAATDAVPGLGRVEQLVLRGDGLTTTSLEVLTGSRIGVRVRGHWELAVPGAAAGHPGAGELYTGLDAPDLERCLELGVGELDAAPGDVLLVRDVLLVGEDGTVRAAAEVVAAARHLPPPVLRALAATDQPIGRLLRDHDVPVTRELRRWGLLPAGPAADDLGPGLTRRSPVPGRVYRMLLAGSGAPLAVLTEWFSPSVFCAQPRHPAAAVGR